MHIDVWSDLHCPFCHLGRRHLELALAQFEHGDEVTVTWHSYLLDRNAPAVQPESVVDVVAAKYGTSREAIEAQHRSMAADAAAVGLDFQWEKLRSGNSFDAHRVIHMAREFGVEQPVTQRLMRGWYTEGEALGDHDTLVRLAGEGGLDADAVREMLGSEDYGINVRTDEATAKMIGVEAVPMFVFDQKAALRGAQPVDVMVGALEQMWQQRDVAPTPRTGGGCGGDCGSCTCGGTAPEAAGLPETDGEACAV